MNKFRYRNLYDPFAVANSLTVTCMEVASLTSMPLNKYLENDLPLMLQGKSQGPPT